MHTDIHSMFTPEGERVHAGDIALPDGRTATVTWLGAGTTGHIEVPRASLHRARTVDGADVVERAVALSGRADLNWAIVGED